MIDFKMNWSVSYLSSSLRHWMMSWVTGSSSLRNETERLALFSQS